MAPADAPALPALPERFERVQVLGRGAQAVTVAAHDRREDRAVAIKVLDLSRVQDWKAFDRFERECAVLQSIDHPGVPAYFEQIRDEARGQYLLVMERVPGHTLAEDIAAGRRRTEAQLLALLEQLMEVLDYLHRLHPPVIHRDLKPSNVVVRPDGAVALVDFGGVAKAFAPAGASTMIGTFGYMAPEQLYGRVTPAADLYALGATIAAVAAGAGAEQLPRRGLEVELEEVVRPGRLRAVLEALLQSDPDHRPSSVAEVRALLEGEAISSPDLPAVATPTAVALDTRPNILAVYWRELGSRQRVVAVGYLWAAAALGIATRAIPLVILLLVLFPVLIGVMRGVGRED